MCPLEGNRKITGFSCIEDGKRGGEKLKNHEAEGGRGVFRVRQYASQ